MTRVVLVLAVLAVSAGLAAWWRRRDGALRVPRRELVDLSQLALAGPDVRTVLLEFTAPACPPCIVARRVLDEVAGHRDDVQVLEVDVARSGALARTHQVLRAPTTLVVGAGGDVLGRVTGVPDAAALRHLLDERAAVA